MANPVEATGFIGSQAIQLHLYLPSSHWWSAYTPAVPGLIVALAGLYIAHRLTLRRERRKEIRDLCDDFQQASLEASEAAADAWLEIDQDARISKVQLAKAKLQTLGIKATSLRRHTAVKRWSRQRFRVSHGAVSIDMRRHVADLRQEATADPFEVPGRQPDSAAAENARSAALIVQAELHQSLADYYGLPN